MLASAAHALRGPVGLFFGDDETASITRKLETMGHRGDLAGAREAYTDLQRRLSRLCDDLRRFEGVRDERGSGQRAKASSGLEVKETERSKSQSTRSLSDGTQASGSKRGGRTARIRFIKSRKQPNLGG
jgi:hypothetical protein